MAHVIQATPFLCNAVLVAVSFAGTTGDDMVIGFVSGGPALPEGALA